MPMTVEQRGECNDASIEEAIMPRRWILAAVSCGLCLAHAAQAQNGVSLSDRLNFFKSADQPRQPQYPDPAYDEPLYEEDFQLAAAAAPAPSSRTSRNSPSAQRSSQPSRGLFGGFRLPSLFGGRKQNDPDSQPPAPYDESDVRAQRQQQAQAQAQGAAAGPTARRAPQSTARSTATNQNGQAGQSTQRTPRASTQAARTNTTPRVARNSPTADNSRRHNELAEALSGLRDADLEPQNDAAEATDVEAKPAPTRRAAASQPTARTAARSTPTKPASPRPSPRRAPVDVSEALLGDEGLNQEIAERAAEAVADADNLGKIPAKAVETTRKSTPAAPVAQPDAANVESDKAPTTQEHESLGDIPAEAAADAFVDQPATSVPAQSATQPVARPAAPTSDAARAAQPAAPTRGVLLSCRQPVITSRVEGPPRIIVGRPATYRVTLENRGDDAARDMTAAVAVPAWAEVVDAAASGGVVERVAATAEGQPNTIQWQLYELPAGGAQTLTLQLIPRGGRPLQLGVQWTHAPCGGQATVEVQEPKLEMNIAGPAEVMFGKSQRYTLTLANPGTGPAEEVNIELTPPGGDARSLVRHRIGALAPGQTKRIELELTARQAGELKIQAVALAAGDLRTEAACAVLCRKAELQVDWRGPDKNYAGAVATYFFRVRNPGTAVADNVGLAVNLPAGCELVDASDGHAWNASQRAVVWKAGALNANEERFLQLRCRMSQPGVNNINVAARTAAGDLSDVKSVPVTIEALADLKLEVSDPKGVIPVGETAVYEIHVKNRGLTAARGVNVVAMFSQGVDPSHVEGGQHAIRDGRVQFRTIDNLPAGAEAVLRIHAQATAAGTHLFRAEVICDDLETKLSAEETTRFFVEEQRWADASTAYSSEAEAATR
jgi:hypothetical protein